MAGLTDEGKETTINVSQPGMNGYGWGGYPGAWGAPGYYGGMVPYNQLPASPTGIVGTILGGIALLGLMGAGAGLLGNRNGWGNGGPNQPEFATVRDLANERLLSSKDAEIGKLEAQLYADRGDNAVRQELQATTAVQGQFNATAIAQIQGLQAQAAQLMGMTTPIFKPVVIKASEAVAASAAPTASGS